jgi:hypothetical protein
MVPAAIGFDREIRGPHSNHIDVAFLPMRSGTLTPFNLKSIRPVCSRRMIWLLLGLMGTTVPTFAQEAAVLNAPLAGATTSVVVPPVATKRQLLQKYVWSTLGIDGVIHATITSGLDQWRKSPPEWGSHGVGYAKRWGSEYAESAIGDTAKYSVARIFHQDPSFTRCECSGLAPRLRHALEAPFRARKRDGTEVWSGASVVGVLAGHVVSASTWYPAPLGARDGLKHAGISLVTKMGVDVFKEFRPGRPNVDTPPARTNDAP